MKVLNRVFSFSICFLFLFSYKALAKEPYEIANDAGNYIDASYNPKGTIVIAQKNGQVLYSDDADTKWPLASMSKLMTLYLLMQEMDKGEITFNTKVKVTDKFYNISKLPALSNNNLRLNAVYTVDELMPIMLTNSSNAATYMLSSLVTKNDSEFIDKMNQEAKRLGMNSTKFYNPVGAPNNLLNEYKAKKYPQNEDNISSAKDYAILCQHLVSEYPGILKYTKRVDVTVKKGTIDEETFHTYNHSLEGAKLGYKGVDGLKTGSSDTAGFNTAITGKKNDMRIIQVMMGVESWYDPPAEFNRNIMANAIMDEVYNEYAYKKVLAKGVHTINGQELYVHSDLYDIVKKDVKGSFQFKDGKLSYHYKRTFVSNEYHAPTVKAEDNKKYEQRLFFQENMWWIVLVSTVSIIAGLLLLLYYYRPHLFRNLWDEK
ncbi:D-alanyl-D-alanine carboxypeptidase [Macrococcoides caseolyticum subsp. caseolyticum]|uniref:DUF1958 domain-containing protein n=1 Tax=Macrococcoides caseolyticum TaxID=69966 RepID=UPI000CD29318|nr:DUF1958 domain-containing protein [Macrococcus caseolyticus]MDJ1089263.1 DUF1958 domain-containing protein [Macrococcus caseolyticus]MDJ1091521.1 DUF1958 domain-containing protein [Macrococcus caseolyticus]PNZ71525.1 DUF1958 domain-containing protein [Macrococcus caseolyticus]QPT46533.1 D-alanyl-D-alanine carboxypeptidase [Macrococcus caseolyticus]RAK45828.1 D-alanyl-D-alanine carboxypeptidase [Macrococcus caseolyticus subsp. caseolyticus]